MSVLRRRRVVRHLRRFRNYGLPTYALWVSIFLVIGILTWSSVISR